MLGYLRLCWQKTLNSCYESYTWDAWPSDIYAVDPCSLRDSSNGNGNHITLNWYGLRCPDKSKHFPVCALAGNTRYLFMGYCLCCNIYPGAVFMQCVSLVLHLRNVEFALQRSDYVGTEASNSRDDNSIVSTEAWWSYMWALGTEIFIHAVQYNHFGVIKWCLYVIIILHQIALYCNHLSDLFWHFPRVFAFVEMHEAQLSPCWWAHIE